MHANPVKVKPSLGPSHSIALRIKEPTFGGNFQTLSIAWLRAVISTRAVLHHHQLLLTLLVSSNRPNLLSVFGLCLSLLIISNLHFLPNTTRLLSSSSSSSTTVSSVLFLSVY